MGRYCILFFSGQTDLAQISKLVALQTHPIDIFTEAQAALLFLLFQSDKPRDVRWLITLSWAILSSLAMITLIIGGSIYINKLQVS